MSQDDSFFDNLWDAGENLVDAAVDVTEGVGHGVVGMYHVAGAAANAVFATDAEDREEMIDHFDAANDEAAAGRESFSDAWDEMF